MLNIFVWHNFVAKRPHLTHTITLKLSKLKPLKHLPKRRILKNLAVQFQSLSSEPLQQARLKIEHLCYFKYLDIFIFYSFHSTSQGYFTTQLPFGKFDETIHILCTDIKAGPVKIAFLRLQSTFRYILLRRGKGSKVVENSVGTFNTRQTFILVYRVCFVHFHY